MDADPKKVVIPLESASRSNGTGCALRLLRWRMFISENRCPLFRNMR